MTDWNEVAHRAPPRDAVRDRMDELFDHHDESTAGVFFDAIEAVLQLCDGDRLCPAGGVCTARPPRTCPAGLVREAIAVALLGDRDG